MEKQISDYMCDETIVNSKALVEYFKPNRVNLIYYTSPFENRFDMNIDKEVAFLYLGAFSKDKGAYNILDFMNKRKAELYIFGDTSKDILERIKNSKNIFYKNRVSSTILQKELEVLFNKYRLVGFSLIKEVHYSYATQEANKDIDYLAMGIPLIANYRIPTKEKIDAGCGVFIDDNINIKNLLNNKDFYQDISSNCLDYYCENYSHDIFENKLIKIIGESKNGLQ
jgi:glycosyltransferase involved in cell wall biosynthesis